MDRSVFELFRLDGKVAIVTGAHAWLGYDIACAFAEAGADVIITSRNVDSIRETAAQIGEKYHVDTLALPLDQRKYENVQKMADAALAWKGHIDILVNNAGGGSGKTEGDFLKAGSRRYSEPDRYQSDRLGLLFQGCGSYDGQGRLRQNHQYRFHFCFSRQRPAYLPSS